MNMQKHSIRVFSVLFLVSIIYCLFLIISCTKNNGILQNPDGNSFVGYWIVSKITTEYNGETEVMMESELFEKGIVWTWQLSIDSIMEMTTNFNCPLTTWEGRWYYEDQQIGFITVENGIAREFIYKGSIQSDKLVLNWEKTNGYKYSADFVKHK